MHIVFKLKDGTEEKIDIEDLQKEGSIAHLTSLDREALTKAAVLIRQDSRKDPVVRVFRYVRVKGWPIYEEVDHYFVNPPGI